MSNRNQLEKQGIDVDATPVNTFFNQGYSSLAAGYALLNGEEVSDDETDSSFYEVSDEEMYSLGGQYDD